MPLTPGALLQGRYRIVSQLGQGGMGAVYRVWDTRLDVALALKELLPQPGLDAAALAKMRGQFRQEARVLARLRHPHLVNVTDYFEEGGKAYLVMEFMEGESLATRIEREGALDEGQVLTWARQLLAALAYCHAQGVLHRDIKPQNVIITPDGEAVLVDFGLVKLWDPNDPQTRTAIRGAGTPEYAPPEQYSQLAGHTEPRSDLYGLGATLYHALTGQAPLTAADRMAYPQRFQPPCALNRRVSAQTDSVIQRALALACDDRWSSASAMAAAFQAAPASSPQARAAPAQSRAAPGTSGTGSGAAWGMRRVPGWVWAVAGLSVVGVLLGVSGVLGGGGAAPVPTETAPVAATRTAAPPAETTQPPTSTPRPTATATPEPELGVGSTRVRGADGMVQVYVPAGEFEMGSTEGNDDEAPVHPVYVDAFWLDQTEVTNAQFQVCVEAGVCEAPLSCDWGSPTYNDAGQASHPVVCVSWYDADAYCSWAGGRLPTEAEWEYAARGPEGWDYPWGNTFDGGKLSFCDANCEYDWADETVDDGYTRTAPVGRYPAGASWVGAYDLAGNVWEWVGDRYGAYSSGRQENPAGPASGEARVLRGGSWLTIEGHVRGAIRLRNDPTPTYDVFGFRCAVVAAPGD